MPAPQYDLQSLTRSLYLLYLRSSNSMAASTSIPGILDMKKHSFRPLGDSTIFVSRCRDPFTVSLPMRRNDQPLFEYACHEGNHGLLNILLGARTDELN